MSHFEYIVMAALSMSPTHALRMSELAESGLGWVEDFDPGTVKFIGLTEVLAALGLVVPPLLDVGVWLTPTAGLGLVLLMLAAALTHARRREAQMIAINILLLGLAAVVAWGRFGTYAF